MKLNINVMMWHNTFKFNTLVYKRFDNKSNQSAQIDLDPQNVIARNIMCIFKLYIYQGI